MAKLSTDEFIQAIEAMSVLELNELVKAIRKFADAMIRPRRRTTAAEPEGEKTQLTSSPPCANKINVISAVRELTSLWPHEWAESSKAS
jgi:ribosomal protein L7/L12